MGGLGPLNNPIYATYDPVLGWTHVPNASARHRSDEFDVAVEINALGLRDRPRTAEPAPGVFRVLAVGDSFTFGFGVTGDEAFPALLDARRPDVEWLNGGVCGYGTDQALLFLEARGLAWRPRLVVLTLCSNDVEENLRDEMYGRAKPRLVVDGERVVRPAGDVPFPWLARTSMLWRSIDKNLWAWRRRIPEGVEADKGRRVLRAILREIARTCAASSIDLVVVRTFEYLELPDRHHGYHVLDLVHPLQGREDLVFARDRHWNPAGHRFVADRIEAFLEQRGLVPTRPPR